MYKTHGISGHTFLYTSYGTGPNCTHAHAYLHGVIVYSTYVYTWPPFTHLYRYKLYHWFLHVYTLLYVWIYTYSQQYASTHYTIKCTFYICVDAQGANSYTFTIMHIYTASMCTCLKTYPIQSIHFHNDVHVQGVYIVYTYTYTESKCTHTDNYSLTHFETVCTYVYTHVHVHVYALHILHK